MSESQTLTVKLPPRAEDGHFPTEDGEEDPRVWKVYATSAAGFPLVSYGEKLMPAWYARRLAAALLAAAAESELAVAESVRLDTADPVETQDN
ncbi:hypothetical protein [Mycobacteroides abscessus]|uniref:hypothetical protein n=1 Tax=Mycobacteroides abscessus TaxID=36809 RepID=UPI0003803763|nr:hypothetical protein [Mycobacteroides abscessus]